MDTHGEDKRALLSGESLLIMSRKERGVWGNLVPSLPVKSLYKAELARKLI